MSQCRRLLLCLLFCILLSHLHGQEKPIDTAYIAVPSSLPSELDKKFASIDNRLTNQSEKYLNSLSKQEERILKALAKFDTTSAVATFNSAKEKYAALSQKLNAANGSMDKVLKGQYFSGIDSLGGSLGFLKDVKNVLSKSKDIQQKLGSSLENLQQLQGKLNEAANIQQFVQQRQQQLKELLSNYTNLPKDISKYFGKYQQQAFYYGQQIKEYKQLLNDPDKLTRKVLATLQTIPAFSRFFSKHSMLAAMFPMPDNYGTPQALAGLQTRANVQQVLQQQMALPVTNGTNANPAQYLQQQMQQAQQQLSQLKDKLSQLGINGSGSGDMVMPENINPEKTKPFWKKIQLGTNFATQRSSQYFPTRMDIAVTAAYKMDAKSQAGIGISSKVGFGKNWKHIRITGESIGARAFIEWKAPDLFKTNSRFMSSLWFYGGAEMNYNRTIESLAVFKNYSNWSKSALAGLTKKYSMNSPLKKGKQIQGTASFLYDFMHRKNIPNTPALVWRVGYNF